MGLDSDAVKRDESINTRIDDYPSGGVTLLHPRYTGYATSQIVRELSQPTAALQSATPSGPVGAFGEPADLLLNGLTEESVQKVSNLLSPAHTESVF
ncbi:MAG: hypothetical protein MUP80_04315 [Acidobacteriia bacterium]|nr:hypothetical protein [Terriglobia bacterium]